MFDQTAYDTAALKDLFGKIPFLNGVLGDISAKRTAEVRRQIAEKRKWVGDLKDRMWRSAYSRWLDHAEYCCDKADNYREERPEQQRRWQESESRRRASEISARDLMMKNPPA